MYITKDALSRSGKKYYRFFSPGNESKLSVIDGNYICRPNSMIEDGIFFAEEEHAIEWIFNGDSLAEVIFDPAHPLFARLPNLYFVESQKYSGKAVIIGKPIHLNQIEMFEFIKKHFDFSNSTSSLQMHLIKNKAYDTLERVWKFKYSKVGNDQYESDLSDAIAYIKIAHFDRNNLEDCMKYQNCNNWDELKSHFK